MAITGALGGNWTMLSNQHGIGDSNRTETDRAGRLEGQEHSRCLLWPFIHTGNKGKKIYSSIVIMVSI